MRHFSFANLYEKVPVCCYCKAMYDKVDFLRVNADNAANPFLKSPRLIPPEVARYLAERDRRDRAQARPERQVFSPAFYADLESFDLPVQPEPEFRLDKSLMDSFDRDLEERRERSERLDRQEMLRRSESAADFVARKVKEVTLKLHVGSREPVRGSELGAVTSSSSLQLARIQTVRSPQQKMRELEKIAFKHKYRFDPSKKQFLETVLCPYAGNGRLDRAPRRRQHVGADEPIHARDADGRQEPTNGRRDETHEQRHQTAESGRLPTEEFRECGQGEGDEDENESQGNQ